MRDDTELVARIKHQARARIYAGFRATGNSRVVMVNDWMPSTKGIETHQSLQAMARMIARMAIIGTITRSQRFWSVPSALTAWLWKIRKLHAHAHAISPTQAQGS